MQCQVLGKGYYWTKMHKSDKPATSNKFLLLQCNHANTTNLTKLYCVVIIPNTSLEEPKCSKDQFSCMGYTMEKRGEIVYCVTAQYQECLLSGWWWLWLVAGRGQQVTARSGTITKCGCHTVNPTPQSRQGKKDIPASHVYTALGAKTSWHIILNPCWLRLRLSNRSNLFCFAFCRVTLRGFIAMFADSVWDQQLSVSCVHTCSCQPGPAL